MLNVKKIALYKHGLGYFEREGEVEGDGVAELHFSENEMNDVLKSLTVIDHSGGTISNISYQSSNKDEKSKDRQDPYLKNWGITGFLEENVGAEVKVKTLDGEYQGMIAGVEKFPSSSNETCLLSLYTDDSTVKYVNLFEIIKVEFLDDKLKKDLKHRLVNAESDKDNLKKLSIFLKGNGRRTISSSYIKETPLWKLSYRIVTGKEKNRIQGWAIVDNNSGEDWDNVDLTLVSGMPISFMIDLYSPQYPKRTNVKLEQEKPVTPPELEDSEDDDEIFFMVDCIDPEEEYVWAEKPKAMHIKDKMRTGRNLHSRMCVSKRAPIKHHGNISSPTEKRIIKSENYVEYSIENPITVKRRQSALVPFINREIECKKAAIYNSNVDRNHPLNVLLIKNNTGITFEGGPVTVIEEKRYGGEAVLDSLSPGKEKILPYRIELGCKIEKSFDKAERKSHRVELKDGHISFSYFETINYQYDIKNETGEDINLLLDHSRHSNWEIEDDSQLLVTTENYYRFQINAPSKKTTAFQVVQRSEKNRSHNLSKIDSTMIKEWDKEKILNEKLKTSLEKFVSLYSGIENVTKKIHLAEDGINKVHIKQSRLRENLKAMDTFTGQDHMREKLADEMAELDRELRKYKTEVDELTGKKKKMFTELKNKIEDTKEGKPGCFVLTHSSIRE